MAWEDNDTGYIDTGWAAVVEKRQRMDDAALMLAAEAGLYDQGTNGVGVQDQLVNAALAGARSGIQQTFGSLGLELKDNSLQPDVGKTLLNVSSLVLGAGAGAGAGLIGRALGGVIGGTATTAGIAGGAAGIVTTAARAAAPWVAKLPVVGMPLSKVLNSGVPATLIGAAGAGMFLSNAANWLGMLGDRRIAVYLDGRRFGVMESDAAEKWVRSSALVLGPRERGRIKFLVTE